MPGETSIGECSKWVADGKLLNCDPEDMNEPFDDCFEARARKKGCGCWVDMNQAVIGDLEAWADSQLALEGADVSIGEYFRMMGCSDFVTQGSGGSGGEDDFDDDSDLSGSDEGDDTLDPDTSLIVKDDAAAEAQAAVDGDALPDHFKRMVAVIQEDVLLPAESRPRAPMGRGVRYRYFVALRN